MSRRIGILGGSFDPPHLGHLALAEAAHAQLGLDVVHVIPAARAPLRDDTPRASDADRILLLRLAFDAFSWAVVDDREIRRGGVSYSIDTARELAAEHPGTGSSAPTSSTGSTSGARRGPCAGWSVSPSLPGTPRGAASNPRWPAAPGSICSPRPRWRSHRRRSAGTSPRDAPWE